MSPATAADTVLEKNSPAMPLFVEAAKAHLADAPVLRADETGVGIGGKPKWAHVAADNESSFICRHTGRGHEGAEAAGKIPEKRPDLFWRAAACRRITGTAGSAACERPYPARPAKRR
ncbi:MAG: hypothetical protein LBW85_02500 [Deltaproteobacteria bacterium]|jgi:hypothetical protein|nr:hypothetical protein [Deltaproteobacteria bacterium]